MMDHRWSCSCASSNRSLPHEEDRRPSTPHDRGSAAEARSCCTTSRRRAERPQPERAHPSLTRTTSTRRRSVPSGSVGGRNQRVPYGESMATSQISADLAVYPYSVVAWLNVTADLAARQNDVESLGNASAKIRQG